MISLNPKLDEVVNKTEISSDTLLKQIFQKEYPEDLPEVKIKRDYDDLEKWLASEGCNIIPHGNTRQPTEYRNTTELLFQ